MKTLFTTLFCLIYFCLHAQIVKKPLSESQNQACLNSYVKEVLDRRPKDIDTLRVLKKPFRYINKRSTIEVDMGVNQSNDFFLFLSVIPNDTSIKVCQLDNTKFHFKSFNKKSESFYATLNTLDRCAGVFYFAFHFKEPHLITYPIHPHVTEPNKAFQYLTDNRIKRIILTTSKDKYVMKFKREQSKEFSFSINCLLSYMQSRIKR